ncbi:TIR domain-containing protein [Paraburkholderia aromaticivorans]|uniref:TIR domain-containing protein n=1 Tax=Paraburkholderia aromaticivorans TaxID=2026199 RepID=UPI0038B9A149
MGYRNKTYVIFDGDEDMWSYAYMRGWNKNENMEFSFYDAHDLRPMSGTASEEYVKRVLKQRLENTKQAIVIIGEKTKNLFRFVRWEIEACIEMGIPIVAVNLNGKREMDEDRCPPILRDVCAIHVPFKAKAIQRALDVFCDNFEWHKQQGWKAVVLKPEVYASLGL